MSEFITLLQRGMAYDESSDSLLVLLVWIFRGRCLFEASIPGDDM